MKTIRIVKKVDEKKDKKSSIREVIEFTNPVEISGDGEYLYITEIGVDSKPNLRKDCCNESHRNRKKSR